MKTHNYRKYGHKHKWPKMKIAHDIKQARMREQRPKRLARNFLEVCALIFAALVVLSVMSNKLESFIA